MRVFSQSFFFFGNRRKTEVREREEECNKKKKKKKKNTLLRNTSKEERKRRGVAEEKGKQMKGRKSKEVEREQTHFFVFLRRQASKRRINRAPLFFPLSPCLPSVCPLAVQHCADSLSTLAVEKARSKAFISSKKRKKRITVPSSRFDRFSTPVALDLHHHHHLSPRSEPKLKPFHHGRAESNLQVLPPGLRPGESATGQESGPEHAQGQDDAADVDPVRDLRDVHGEGGCGVFLFYIAWVRWEEERGGVEGSGLVQETGEMEHWGAWKRKTHSRFAHLSFFSSSLTHSLKTKNKNNRGASSTPRRRTSWARPTSGSR